MDGKLIFDAHTHFNDSSYREEGYSLSQMIKDANQSGVGYFCNVAFDVDSSKLAIQQAQNFAGVYATVGIHPMDVHNFQTDALDVLDLLADEKKVVAVGEVGLDYFWKKDNRAEQKQWFIDQIKIAQKHDLTLMMHIRDERNQFDAYDDVLEIIAKHHPKRMIVHCFSANTEYAKKFLNLGCYINIGGAVTFKNAHDLQEAARIIPLDHLLVETDAPYLTPHPFRGQKNFSKMITYTVQKIADLKGISYEAVVQVTTENAFKIFNLD